MSTISGRFWVVKRLALALAMLLALTIPNPGAGIVLGKPMNLVDMTAMAFDSQGYAHIAYINNEGNLGLYYATNATGTWVSRPIATTGYEWQPRIAIDALDAVHIIFIHRVDTEYKGIYHASNAGGSWHVEYLVKDSLVQHGVAMAMTGDGTIHLAWDGAPYAFLGLFYATYASGVVTITQLPLGNHGTGAPMSLAIGADGSAHIAFEESTPYANLSVVSNAGGSWHFIAAQSIAGYGPVLGKEPDNKIHLLSASGGYFTDCLEDGTNCRTIANGSFSESFNMSFSPTGIPVALAEKTVNSAHNIVVLRGGRRSRPSASHDA